MNKKNRWGRVLLSLLFSLSMVIGLLPINSWAMIVPDQDGVKYDEQGYLTSTNSEALQEKIKAAEDLGVTVNVIDQTNTPVHANAQDALDAIKAIRQNNEKQIQTLETKITTQKNNNQDYLNSLKTMLKTLRQKGGANSGEEWTEDQLYEFLLPQEDLAKSPEEKLKSISPLSVVTAGDKTELIKEHIQQGGYFSIGDYIRYTKVFRDNQTGNWVDLRLTLMGITQVKGTDAQKLKLYRLDKNQPYLQYTTDDATIKVDFLENGTDNPISVRPILGFVDVDEGQGIKMDSPSNSKVLFGSDINLNAQEQSYRSQHADGTEGTLRRNWVMFRPLNPIDSFTYTFFAPRNGSNLGILQGIGGVSIPYATNTHESIDIHVIKQPIYHKVSYQFVGNYPKKAKLPTDATKYAVGQKLNVAADPEKISGWTFLGWFENQTLKTPIQAHPVNADEIIYGAWKKKHTPPTISSSVSSSLPQSSDSMSTVPGIPQTPEQPPETPNTPKPTKPNDKAPRTGELENRMWGITLLGLAVAAVGFATIKKKKSMR